MIKGFFTLAALCVGGLVALAAGAALVIPVVGLLAALVIAIVKLAFFLALVYFIVRLVSPETAERAYETIRSKINRVAEARK